MAIFAFYENQRSELETINTEIRREQGILKGVQPNTFDTGIFDRIIFRQQTRKSRTLIIRMISIELLGIKPTVRFKSGLL